jgi:hypothetical protein
MDFSPRAWKTLRGGWKSSVERLWS